MDTHSESPPCRCEFVYNWLEKHQPYFDNPELTYNLNLNCPQPVMHSGEHQATVTQCGATREKRKWFNKYRSTCLFYEPKLFETEPAYSEEESEYSGEELENSDESEAFEEEMKSSEKSKCTEEVTLNVYSKSSKQETKSSGGGNQSISFEQEPLNFVNTTDGQQTLCLESGPYYGHEAQYLESGSYYGRETQYLEPGPYYEEQTQHLEPVPYYEQQTPYLGQQQQYFLQPPSWQPHFGQQTTYYAPVPPYYSPVPLYYGPGAFQSEEVPGYNGKNVHE